LDYAFIKKVLYEDARAFRRSKNIGIDRLQRDASNHRDRAEAWPVEKLPAGFRSMSPPFRKNWSDWVMSNGLHHGDHPVLGSPFKGGCRRDGRRGQNHQSRQKAKKSTQRIDVLPACVNAIGSHRNDEGGQRQADSWRKL